MLPEHRLGCALEIAPVEVEFDNALGVAVGNAEKALVDAANDVKLFEQFAPKRLLVVLMRVALSPRKFPMSGEIGSIRAEGQKKLAVTLDNGGHDDDYRGCLQNLKVPEFTVQITRTGELWNLDRRAIEPGATSSR